MKNLKITINKILLFFSSNWFMYIVIAIFVLQSLWIAFSFRYPMLFDEKFHFETITFLSHNRNFFLLSNGSQNNNFDYLGSVAFGGTTLFHYILGFIFLISEKFINSFTALIIIFRILNIAFVSIGLYYYSYLFKKIKVNSLYINLGLALYILIPISTLSAATINYDNLLFMCTPLFLIAGINILELKSPMVKKYIIFLIMGLFTSLVKPAFLPIFFVGFIIIVVSQYRFFNKKYSSKLSDELIKSKYTLFPLFLLLITLIILFTQRYVYTTIRFGTPLPDCSQVLSFERCQSNDVYKLESMVIATKNERTVVTLTKYISSWYNKMFLGYGITAANTTDGKSEGFRSSEILNDTIFILVTVFIIAIIYQRKSNNKNVYSNFVLYSAVALVLTTIYFNASSYYRASSELNLNPRYLLCVMPVLFINGLKDLDKSLGKHTFLKTFAVILVIIIFTQGGGLSTHILKSNDRWYWQDYRVLYFNNKAKQILQPLVK